MKKICLFLVVFLTSFSIGLKKINAEENVVDDTVVEETITEEVYTNNEEGAEIILKLKSDGTFTISAVQSGTGLSVEVSGTYIDKETYLELYRNGAVLCSIWINNETKSFSFYDNTEEKDENIIEKVYTYEDEDATVTLTLRSDMTYTMVAVEPYASNEIVLNGMFQYGAYGNIELFIGEEHFDNIFLDETTMTFDFDDYEKPVVDEEIVYPCNVVIIDSSYGEVVVDITEGNVGDVVTITPKSYAFCKLINIMVNGAVITPNESGVYEFLLVEGENKITSVFEISREDMAILAENINNYEKGFFEKIFSIENIFNLISWVMTTLFSTGFLVVLLKNKKVKALTGDEISTSVNDKIPDKVTTVVEQVVQEVFSPMFNTMTEAFQNINNCVETLTRCTILAQENTSESRLAILDEIAKVKSSTKELQEEARAIINSEVIANMRNKLEQKLVLEELEKKNQEIIHEESDLKGRV